MKSKLILGITALSLTTIALAAANEPAPLPQPAGSGGTVTNPPPDILVLMPDQMRGDCLSLLGNPGVRTPHLDELARQGALFRRAYSTCPSCIPARFAMLTGLHPETTGVVGFRSRPITTPTFPEVLGANGYVTVLAGRTMHQNPPNKSVGYQQEILGSTYVPDDEYDRYLKEEAPQSGGIHKLVSKTGVTYNWWQAKPWPLADDLHPTAWAVRQAEKVVADTPAGKPLFLTASFYSPHSPLFPPKKFFEACLSRKLPAPAHGDWVDWASLSPKGNGEGDRVLLEGDALRNAEAGYFGLIDHLDVEIAPLVAAFKARSEKAGRPWVIVFTSDHGEMLGDNGYYRKCEPYEGSANIPFIICGAPSLGFKPGLRSFAPVCLEDLMPTLLALADVKQPPATDGVNLVPVLRGEQTQTRAVLQFEHAICYNKAQAFQALTDGHFKYIWRTQDGSEQLFNLDQDPREEHDLSQVASERPALEQWHAQMVKLLANRPEGFSDSTNLIAGRPYPAIQVGAGQGPKPNRATDPK